MKLEEYFKQIVRSREDSHKGQNGRVLVIGGSKLFHAAAFWAASMASKIVDLVHFTSPAMENNDLMRVQAKSKFWEGIVIPWEEVEHYIQEDDVILIGPGMPRDEGLMKGERPTGEIVNYWLRKYPDKKWVIDGGALQEADVALFNGNMIVTPNKRELEILKTKTGVRELSDLAAALNGVTVLAKGEVDTVVSGIEQIKIEGGNAGMTKGGTGDVLAGLVAGLYAKSPIRASAVTGSWINKQAGEKLGRKFGEFFAAEDLIKAVQIQIPETLESQ